MTNTLKDSEIGKRWRFRQDLHHDGYAVTWVHDMAVTAADVRAATDAMFCERPALNAVALRWDGR